MTSYLKKKIVYTKMLEHLKLLDIIKLTIIMIEWDQSA